MRLLRVIRLNANCERVQCARVPPASSRTTRGSSARADWKRPTIGVRSRLVRREHRRHVARCPCAPNAPAERDRVLHGQLGPRPDREVRRVRGVADERDVARAASAALRDGRERSPDASGSSAAGARRRSSRNRSSRYATVAASSALVEPARFQTSSRHSTMNVLVRSSNGYAWTWNRPCSFSLEDEREGVRAAGRSPAT